MPSLEGPPFDNDWWNDQVLGEFDDVAALRSKLREVLQNNAKGDERMDIDIDRLFSSMRRFTEIY
jgi:hypothetical protein